VIRVFGLYMRPARLRMAIRSGGFSAIEMMAVLAVIAILALMAIPGYQDKFVRDQIVEALPLADIGKAPIAASWAIAQTFPADNAAAGLPVADKIVSNFISSLAIQDGAIHLTFGNRANAVIKGKILTLRPAVVEDAPVVPVAWVCGYATGPDKMTVKGANNTNIPANFLPFKCRAG
jgi:type IV pilus assembly protein PilA